MKKTFSYVLRLALTLLLITAAMAAALAGVNKLTANRIAAAKKEKTDRAIAEVIELPEQAELEEVPFVDETGMVKKVYRPTISASSGMTSLMMYAVEVTPSGFDGEITMMVGVDAEGKVSGISIISHTETAGLGAVAAADNAAGKAFRNQFVGMSGQLAVTKDGGDVDAITGATVTSRAVCNGINAALACVHQIQQEVQP